MQSSHKIQESIYHSSQGSARHKGATIVEDNSQLPSINQPKDVQVRKSSLRILQERRSGSKSSRSRQEQFHQQNQSGIDSAFYQQQQQQYPNLLMNMTQDMVSLERRQIIAERGKGRSMVDGNINMYQTETHSLRDFKQEFDEQSQVIQTGAQVFQAKRSPSDFVRRKASQPVTPRKQSSQMNQIIDPATERFMLGSAGTARQSFKLQSLAPLALDNIGSPGVLPELSQTQRIYSQGGSGQIGPLFSQNNNAVLPAAQLKLNLQNTPVNRGAQTQRKPLLGQSKRSSPAMRAFQANDRNRASTFSFSNAQPKEVSEFLQQIIQDPVTLMLPKAQELDSTEALDSFLDSLYFMVEEKICDFNEQIASKLHLATGMRTDTCEDFLCYLAQLQTRNKLLINAVQFFDEYLTKISQLEGDKEDRERLVNQLIEDKEELFLTKYDLEKKLKELSENLKESQDSQKDFALQMKQLQKKYDAKISECESLMFRLKHMEELSQMMEPPPGGTQSSIHNIKLIAINESPQMANNNLAINNGNALNTSIGDLQQTPSRVNGYQQDQEKLRQLEASNKRLETELKLMRDALQKQQEIQFKDNVEHFVKIQELYNKVQIENKQLRSTNKKNEAKLEAKERLTQHLENKITTVMVEKEDIIVKLKSEIVLLKQQIDESVKNFDLRILQENQKFQKEFQSNFSSQEKRIKDEKDQLVREKTDLQTKIQQQQNDLEQMAADFTKYREDITKKDIVKESNIRELLQKLKESSQLNESQARILQERIDTYNNQLQVISKQNTILELKLRLLRDSVETLYKQKMFIFQNIEKARADLARESAQMEQTMMNENGNQEYLISVKKAVKLNQTMVDMGLNSIQQVSQIVSFLKIDEVRNLIVASDAESITKAHVNVSKELQQQEIEKVNQLLQLEDIQDGDQSKTQFQNFEAKVQPSSGLKIQKYISNEKVQEVKQEEHYYNECAVEMSSILCKVLAETLITFGIASDNTKVPMELYKLLSLGDRKADPQVEQEIYNKYLSKTKGLIEEKYNKMNEENKNIKAQIEKLQAVNLQNLREKISLSKIEGQNQKQSASNDENKQGTTGTQQILSGSQSLSGLKSRLRNLSKLSSNENQLPEVSNQQQASKNSGIGESTLKRDGSVSGAQGPIQILEDSQIKRRISSIESRINSAKRQPIRQLLKSQDTAALEQQLDTLRIKMQEQKIKHKEVSLQLAQKIVILEEQIEAQKLQAEQDITELEQLHREEIERTKQAVQQREAELMQKQFDLKDRAEVAEEQLVSIKEQVASLNREIERIVLYKKEFDTKLLQKEEEIASYKENVQTFVNLKVSQRSIFSLTLEITPDNESLITEAMLRYYFNKCIKIDKDKFRFINTEELTFTILKQNHFKKDQMETPDEEVTVHKVIVEIIDDQENIDRYFKTMKCQIKEGTSILYDLQPLYLSINLGQCGIQLQDNKYLKDYHMIKRRGHIIKDEDYVISILRHKHDPLSFKIIATSSNFGEEFILDLSSKDIFELTEGKNNILEKSEPSKLIEFILENLTIVVNSSTGAKTLGCEHKVFFNPIFINKHIKVPNKSSEIEKILGNNGDLSNTQQSQDSLAFRNTSFRNKLILNKVTSVSHQVNQEYKEKIYQNVECQTESNTSSVTSLQGLPIFKQGNGGFTTDEIFINTFQGYQRVGKGIELKIKIDEGQKTGALIMSFEEIRTKDKSQICMFDQHLEDRYVVHSECLRVVVNEDESHLLLITFERFQLAGFLIKLHDLKLGASEEFFIMKKSNGQYSRLTRSAGLEALLANGKEHEELRNLIFDLTFTLSVPSQQILYASLAAVDQQIIQLSQEQNIDPNLIPDPFQLPIIKRVENVKDNQKSQEIEELLHTQALKMEAFARYQQDQYQLPTGILLQKHERGELLYRNVFTVRCIFEDDNQREHNSLISFYTKKDGLISVEVFLFREAQKMSIASQVSAQDLFGVDYHSLNYSQKVMMLDQMMEKLYVLSENNQFHLKVENDAVPITEYLDSKEKTIIQQKTSQLPDNQRRPGEPVAQEKDKIIENLDQKLEEINRNKEEFLLLNKNQAYKTYSQIDEVIYEYKVYFLLKPEKEPILIQSSPSKKGKQSFKKSYIERQSTVSTNIEDLLDFQYVYIEATNKSGNGEKYTNVLNIKLLSKILMSNPYQLNQNYKMIQSKNKESLVEYLKNHSEIDHQSRKLIIKGFQPSKQLIAQIYSNEIGGVYLKREENEVKAQIEKEMLEKKLLMNQEMDMAEFSYDVKLYQVFSKTKEPRALCYCLEIFALNDPDLVYRYNYALNEQSSFIHAPIHIGYDVINLIELSQNKVKNGEEDKRKIEFQQVFQKYIDNKLILTVHEQIFPHQINFCIQEQSSRLHWTYTFDPQQADSDYIETLSKTTFSSQWNIELGQLSIIDLGTAERFLALLMTDILESQKAFGEPLQSEMREDNWNDLGDSEALRYELLRGRQIGGEFNLTLAKIGIDCLKIELSNASYMEEIQVQEQTKLGGDMFTEVNRNLVRFIINASKRDKYVCKLLRIKDQEINRLLMLSCDLKPHEIVIRLLELKSSTLIFGEEGMKNIKFRVLYQYHFKEKKVALPKQDALNLIDRYQLEDSLIEVFSCGHKGITTQQIVEKASQLFEIMNKKEVLKPKLSIFQDNLSVTQRRLNALAGLKNGIKGDRKQIILHRKSFFDESHEKLIIVSVAIRCLLNRRKGNSQYLMCMEDIVSFKLIISEPETQKKMEFELEIDQCFLQDELMSGIDLKNITHLKKMAKVLVEERAIIKRVSRDLQQTAQEDNQGSQNLYTVEINLSSVIPFNPNDPYPRNTASQTGQLPQNQVDGSPGQEQDSKGVAASKSKEKTGSLDIGASSSTRNMVHIPEDEGGDEFEDMENAALLANKNLKAQQQTQSSQSNNPLQNPKQQQTLKMNSPEILPPHQSIIEEEGSQEEYEDSPDIHNRGEGSLSLRQKQDLRTFQIKENNLTDEQKSGSRDRYQLEPDEDAEVDQNERTQSMLRMKRNEPVLVQQNNEEDEDGYNENINEDDMSQTSELELLYERKISSSNVLQVYSVSSKEQQFAQFQVRLRNTQNGDTQMELWIDDQMLQTIVKEARLSAKAVEHYQGELFEAITEYVINKVLKQQ